MNADSFGPSMRGEFDPTSATPSDWAHMYRRLGYQVVPAMIPSEARAGEPWKRPALKHWRSLTDKLVADDVFESWYGPAGQCRDRWQMGVITGKASGGLFVVDTDQRDGKDGEAVWRGWLAVHNNRLDLETPTQRTGGGGRQRFFHAPPGVVVPTFSTPRGLDIRGQGGFAMLPPSMHESGEPYAWELGLGPWEVEP
jgi:hypothetical protein